MYVYECMRYDEPITVHGHRSSCCAMMKVLCDIFKPHLVKYGNRPHDVINVFHEQLIAPQYQYYVIRLLYSVIDGEWD